VPYPPEPLSHAHTHSEHECRLKNSDKVPSFVDRAYHPPAQTSSLALATVSSPIMVAGTHRFQYFRRPLLAAGSTSMLIKAAVVDSVPPPPPPAPEPQSKTVGTQSDFRESEAQTTAWDHDVQVNRSCPPLHRQGRGRYAGYVTMCLLQGIARLA
jgi:hypothetical protein